MMCMKHVMKWLDHVNVTSAYDCKIDAKIAHDVLLNEYVYRELLEEKLNSTYFPNRIAGNNNES